MDNELIVKNVVKEILRECNIIHTSVQSKFCQFYVKLLMMDPNWGISEDVMQIRSCLQKFIKFAVSELKDPSRPCIVALRIQFLMEVHFEVMEYATKEHRKGRDAMLYGLRVSVLEPTLRDKTRMSGLIEKIVFYITLASGLGDPYHKAVYREVQTVFRSVCNEDELREFTNLLYTVRAEKLNHFVKVVSGIRLFNRDCKRGGHGIQDLPGLLFRAIEAVKKHLTNVISDTKKKVAQLVTIIQSCYFVNYTGYKVTLDVILPKLATDDDLEHCKGTLVVYEQYCEAVGKLIAEVERIKKAALIVKVDQDYILEFLHQKVISNMYVRALTIFPVFESFYDKWVQFQDNTVRLMGVKLFFQDLSETVSVVEFSNDLVKNYQDPTRIQQKMKHSPLSRELLKSVNDECKVFRKDTISSWCRQRYEYAGYCPWYVVLTKGAVVRGNDEYGIVKYKKYFYIFSSPLGVQCFMRDPEYYIDHVLDLAREKSELILYLRLKKQLLQLQNRKKLVDKEDAFIETQDGETSTGTDLSLPNSKSPEYTSNIWTMRKRACQMAYLSNCKTSSTQTERSFNKNCIQSQASPPRESGTQTKVDNYSGTPTPIHFLYGLRGRTDARQLMLDLTYGELK